MGKHPSDFGCNTETDLPSSVTEGDEIDIMEDVTTGMQVSETADMSGDCPLVFCENMTDGQKRFCNLSYAEQSPSFSGNSASITMYMPYGANPAAVYSDLEIQIRRPRKHYRLRLGRRKDVGKA